MPVEHLINQAVTRIAARCDKSAAKGVIDELELVNTQFLRTILEPADSEQTAEPGFDPYDHS